MINWQDITEGYNDLYNKSYTENQMWRKLYPKYTSHEIEKILGVNCMTILARLRQQKFEIEPRGQRHPTRLEKFKAIPRHIRGMLTAEELVKMTGACKGTIKYYRVMYGG